MKKLITGVLIFCGIATMAQSYNEAVQFVTADTITTDKYYWVKLERNVAWRMTTTYASNTSTLTTIAPVTKSTTYGTPSVCAGFAATAATVSSTTVSFMDENSLDEWIGLFVDIPAGGGSIVVNSWYYFSKK